MDKWAQNCESFQNMVWIGNERTFCGATILSSYLLTIFRGHFDLLTLSPPKLGAGTRYPRLAPVFSSDSRIKYIFLPI